MIMLKTIIVALSMLSTVTHTTYGTPVNAKDGDAAANPKERSGLISSRNRRAGMKLVTNVQLIIM